MDTCLILFHPAIEFKLQRKKQVGRKPRISTIVFPTPQLGDTVHNSIIPANAVPEGRRLLAVSATLIEWLRAKRSLKESRKVLSGTSGLSYRLFNPKEFAAAKDFLKGSSSEPWGTRNNNMYVV